MCQKNFSISFMFADISSSCGMFFHHLMSRRRSQKQQRFFSAFFHVCKAGVLLRIFDILTRRVCITKKGENEAKPTQVKRHQMQKKMKNVDIMKAKCIVPTCFLLFHIIKKMFGDDFCNRNNHFTSVNKGEFHEWGMLKLENEMWEKSSDDLWQSQVCEGDIFWEKLLIFS